MAIETQANLEASIIETRPRYLWMFMVFYAMVAFVSGWFDPRHISIFGLYTGAGSIAFPLTYILADVITEVYGYKNTRLAIIAGLFFYPVFLFYGEFVLHFINPAYIDKAALGLFLHYDGYILVGSLASYVIAESVNSYLVAKLKIALQGRYIGLRFLLATLMAYVFDELAYAPIAFHGLVNTKNLMQHMLDSWIFMVAIELLVLPISVRLAKRMKIIEGIDIYDNRTNFSLFSLNTRYSKQDNHGIRRD